MSLDPRIQAELDAKRWYRALRAHYGKSKAWLNRYEGTLGDVLVLGEPGRRRLRAEFWGMLISNRNITAAVLHLIRFGGTSRGPDGYSVRVLYDKRVGLGVVRAVRDEFRTTIRLQGYRPGPVRIEWKPKASGRGTRPIVHMTIFDKVVHRMVVQILRPILRQLTRRQDGFTACVALNRHKLLARAEQYLLDGWSVVVVDDFKDAFTAVPQRRLLQNVLSYLEPNDRVAKFFEALIVRRRRRGIMQGAATSPMFLDIYLHVHFDRVWRRRYPQWPLLRYVDDIIIFTPTVEEAKQAATAMQDLATAIGMTPKAASAGEPTIRDLARGESVDYLGFEVGLANDAVEFRLKSNAVDRFSKKLREAAQAGGTRRRGRRLASRMLGWVRQQGPVPLPVNAHEVWDAIAHCGRRLGLGRPPSFEVFCQGWRSGNESFAAIRQETQFLMNQSVNTSASAETEASNEESM